jgi:EF hand domain-containing protein
LHFRAAAVTLNLSIYSTSRNWFLDLDVNRDGRLSRKELQDGWERLTEGREPRDGLLGFPGADNRLTAVFHRGNLVNMFTAQNYLNPAFPRVAPTRGPLWFRKMDRNGDGYVSRREFLGTKAEFDKLDRNGDGLIDVAEAEAAGSR